MMNGMCCRTSYGGGAIASGAKPSASIGKKRLMDLYLSPTAWVGQLCTNRIVGVSQQQWIVLTGQETGTEIYRKDMW